MRHYYFLAGLPRTGSTLLASILNQHPEIFASGTSPLVELLTGLSKVIDSNRTLYNIPVEQEMQIYRDMFGSFYQFSNKKYIFDKHRLWPKLIPALQNLGIKQPKMIVTLRPVPEIIASYITLINKNPNHPNFIDELLTHRNIAINTTSRAMTAWIDYIAVPHKVMVDAIASNRENLYIVQYNDIISNPTKVLDSLCDFFEIGKYNNYSFSNIINPNVERDEDGWKLKDLHKIRPQLEKTSKPPEEIIGKELTDYFSQFNIVANSN
jgi:sulfotransferase